MWTMQTSSRDNWETLVAAVIKREQIRQLCHQDSITTVDSDFSQRDLSVGSVSFAPSPQLPPPGSSVIKDRKGGSGAITKKLFSALIWRKKAKDHDLVDIPVVTILNFGIKRFSLRELQVATDNFNQKNFLGWPSGFEVYKGRLADGSLVSVNKLTGSASEVKMRNELEISSTVAHRNVIDVLGFCITETERLLVYRYTANGCLEACLRGRDESRAPLKWVTRKRIAVGVGRGVAYLHHGCIRPIIHRDIRTRNILLDEDFEAAVADFTLPKFLDCEDDDGEIVGTIGHIAPEYLRTGKPLLKSDVYGYGVFLLELISGQLVNDLVQLPMRTTSVCRIGC